MKNKHRILVPLLLLLSMLLLTACHAAQPMEIRLTNRPSDTQFTILLYADGSETWALRAEEELPAYILTEAEASAQAEGWYRADSFIQVETRWADSGCIRVYYQGGSTKAQALDFCERAHSIRIAELDENGGICSIGDEIDLYFDGKMYVPYYFDYDAKNGEITVTKGVYRTWHGKTMETWWFEAETVTQIVGLLLLAAGCLCMLMKQIRRRLTVQWILFACMTVPHLLTAAFYLVLRTSPAYTWDNALTSEDALVLVLSNLIWAVSLLMLIIETVILHKKGLLYESH